MKIFIAGICGVFMGGLAQLARAAGHQVTGCDENVYPPMSSLLAESGIDILPGYDPGHLAISDFDEIIIGNALARGNPLIEAVLDSKTPYTSGAQWLKENILRERKVIAIAGTHGKTTTSALLTWILHKNGLQPGYLIGGKPGNFAQSAAPGEGDWFVVEADEYDSAFFDKRSKFVHYTPKVAVLHNLEFDHADIFNSIEEIQRQFHHFVRIIPPSGVILYNASDHNLQQVLDRGLWSQRFGYDVSPGHAPAADWLVRLDSPDGTSLCITPPDAEAIHFQWGCYGRHNAENALAAVAAAMQTGLAAEQAVAALQDFIPVRRRLEKRGETEDIVIFEDFAHHPTAIQRTLETLRTMYAHHYLLAIVEPRSNTMRLGIHDGDLAQSLRIADRSLLFCSAANRRRHDEKPRQIPCVDFASGTAQAMAWIREQTDSGSSPVVIAMMSNGSFDGLIERVVDTFLGNPRPIREFP